jgi:hypothetical protein
VTEETETDLDENVKKTVLPKSVVAKSNYFAQKPFHMPLNCLQGEDEDRLITMTDDELLITETHSRNTMMR